MLHVVLDWQKMYMIVLEKAFLFCSVSIFFGSHVKKINKMALLRGEN
jgi:hypothetical protein